jgi:hypothetical protein
MVEQNDSKTSNPVMSLWASLSRGKRTAVYVVGAVVGLLILSGLMRSCGSPVPVPTVTQTVQVTVTVTATPKPSKSPLPSSTPASVPSAPAPAPAPAETFEMPMLVGQNLQVAQDILQSYGSFFLSQEDASGAGRSQLIDSNWYVCTQSPQAGAVVSIAEFVTLWSVKLSESCP